MDLQKYFRLAESQESVKSGKIGTMSYELHNGLLYRIYKVPDTSDVSQLVVPVELRKAVLRLAHDSIMSGHEGINNTVDRVIGKFWWPGVQ